MHLHSYRHLWGVTEPLETFLPHLKARGYVGVEAHLPDPLERTRVAALLSEHGLKLIAQVITPPAEARLEPHLDTLERQLEEVLALGPEKIVVHAGLDAWTDAECERFYARALEVCAASSVPLGFETHRGRPTYTPWRTAWLLGRFPELKLVCDFSHWVVVSERLLEDQASALERAAQACIHLHTRVGFEHGPQVADPRAPEWRAQLETFERWWGRVWEVQQERGDAISTFTPEFGPPDYQPTLPYTRAPLSDLNAVCDWMASHLLERFERSFPVPV